MKANKIIYLLFLALGVIFSGCSPEIDDKPDIGPPPTASDVTFTFEPDPDNANIIYFTNTSSGFILKWDFGNGSTAEGNNVKGIYPLKGEYTVTLTAYTRSGSASSSQTVVIEETNPALLDVPEFNLLTGGVDQLEGKTWVIDGERAGHMGVGPANGEGSNAPIWWQAPPLDKAGQGIYDDEMTFKLLDFVYEFKNNGDVFANGASAGDLGGDPSAGDQLVPYSPEVEVNNWSITEEGDKKFLNISNGSFFGFYTGVSKYEILNLEENELYVRFLDSKDPNLAWYHRLIPKGYTPPPPPAPEVTDEFKLDFEGEDPAFEVFGGQSYQVIDNPDPTGINTSARVGETVHGNETWAGLFHNVGSKLDLSQKNGMKLKVWSPVEGIARLKLENSENTQEFTEVDANMTTTNEWTELTFDLTGATSELYDRVVLFFDFGSSNPNTFYFDDVELVELNAPVTELTIDFEDGGPEFFTFGGQSYQSVVNPDPSGVNTSATVGETVHGFEIWAGLGTTIDGKLDFSQNTAFKVKVWSPVIGTMKLKLEDSSDPQNVFVEVDVTNTKTNEWEELEWNFEGQPSGVYDNIVLFFDFGNTDPNTFYFDDITFTTPSVDFNLDVLTGGSTKTWRLNPDAAALAVGPGPGSSEWWSNGAEEVTGARACWFNDEYIFSSDGTYAYDAKGDIYAEGYMGVGSDGCIAEGDVPAEAQAWTSGQHTFTFTPGTEDQNATITVTGTGAFVALPKAFNGGEYAAAPPADNASVTYEVLSYEQQADKEVLVLTIDISEGQTGGAYWTFTLISN